MQPNMCKGETMTNEKKTKKQYTFYAFQGATNGNFK